LFSEQFYFEAFPWLEKGVNKHYSFLFKNLIIFECANLQFFFNKQTFSTLFLAKFKKLFLSANIVVITIFVD